MACRSYSLNKVFLIQEPGTPNQFAEGKPLNDSAAVRMAIRTLCACGPCPDQLCSNLMSAAAKIYSRTLEHLRKALVAAVMLALAVHDR